jgi:ABC-type multidrug transport system permease subunit
MNPGVLIKFIIPILFVVMGLMAKYSHNDGWSSVKKYWIYLVVFGAVSLVYNVFKYLM